MNPLLEIVDLTTCFRIDGRWHPAVRGVSLRLAPNETLALVGESGCGKSVTAMSVLRLLPDSGCRIERGEVRFRDATCCASTSRRWPRSAATGSR